MSARLLCQIELPCAAADMAPSRFGRSALNDSRLLIDLRNGRQLRAATLARVVGFLNRETAR